MMNKYYSLKNITELNEYLQVYIPLVNLFLKHYSLDLKQYNLLVDHIGVQMLNSDDFDQITEQLNTYSTLIKVKEIHNRRNGIFKLNTEFIVNGLLIPSIEIFEPKPDFPPSQLRLGIEHIAFYTDSISYDSLLAYFKQNQLPIDKEGEFSKGSKFFKTTFINGVEIEFRNDQLINVA